ncbi:hypothetical protein DH2020_010442 [Rehmannia glutinosa]|uniref:Nucleic acid binding NABP domain-containing protein n=1 Tax=Rehmannia glutinosa TaxID=99300 RepID=A0ABR0XAP4_REHGL
MSWTDFCGPKEEHIMQAKEWSGDGLIGLPGLGLGSQHNNIADMVQTSLAPVSRAFQDTESSESHMALHHELASLGALHSGTNIQGVSSLQSFSSSVSQTYNSAMGASLSRNTTPDPQVVVRSPNPHIPARVSSMDRRNVNVPNLFDDVSPDSAGSADLIASLSGLSLSMDSLVDERKHPTPLMHDEFDAHRNLFHLQRNKNPIKQHPYLNENLKGPSTPTLNSGGSSPSQYFNIPSPTSSLSNYGLGGYPASPLVLGNQVGGGNIPPLVDSGISGIDARALGGGLTLAAAAELENFSRLGNHSSGMLCQWLLWIHHISST